HDSDGRVLWTEDALGHKTWFGYDSFGRQVKTIVNAVGTATKGGENDPRSDSYVPSEQHDEDIITRTAYEPQGHELRTEEALGHKSWFGYESLGRQVTSIVNAVGSATDGGEDDPRSDSYVPSEQSGEDIISRTPYDPQGRVLWTEDALGHKTWF